MWFVLGGVPLLLGIVAVVLAIVLVEGANAALKKSVENAVVISSASDESYENFVTTKVGVSNGGSFPDDEDEGLEHISYISNVTNLMEVYTMGAKPRIEDVAYTFRRYTYYREVSVEGERLKFVSQVKDFPSAETKARWEQDVVFVPNLGWSGLKANLDALTAGARAAGDAVTLAAPFTQVEDLLRPVFASATLNAVVPSVDGFLRTAMFPVFLSSVWPTLTNSSSNAGLSEVINRPPNAAQPTNFLNTLGAAWLRNTEVHAAAFIPNFNATVDRPTVAEALQLYSTAFESSSLVGAAIPASAAATAWTSLTAAPAFLGVFAAVKTKYAAAFGGSIPSDTAITRHVGYLIYHLFGMLTPAAPASVKMGFEGSAVGTFNTILGDCTALLNFGGSGPSGTLTSWRELVGVHMGTGALLPLLGVFGTTTFACSTSSAPIFAAYANVAPYSPNNGSAAVCDAGTSLFDIVNNPAVLPSTPEMACTANRMPSQLDRLVGARHYGSRLPANLTAELLTSVTTGPTVGGAAAASLLGPQPGTNAVRAIAVTRAAMMTAWPSIVTKAAPLAAAVAQAQAAGATSATSAGYVAGNRTAVEATLGVENKACGDRLVSFGLPRMTCLQLFDTFSWLDHVARNFAFFPTVVFNSPFTTAAARTGVNPAVNLMSGPYVKSTAREVLQNGTFDSLLGALVGPSAARSPLALTSPDRSTADFLAANPVATKGTVLNNGATDISKLWTVMEFDGSATDTTFQATVLNPSASISYGGLWSLERREPTFDVNADIADAPLVEKGFLSTIRRFVNVVLTGKVKGPHGLLDLWRYELLSTAEMRARGVSDPKAVQESTSDNAWGQPVCMIGTRPTDITKPGADVFVSSPHYALCDTENDLQYPDGARVDAPRSTFTTTSDVDPVSGITLAGTQRVGIYVRMSGSDWYPTIPRRSGTKDYYHQLSWQLLKAEAPKEAETNLNDGYNQVRTVQTDLPPGLFAGGALLIIIGLLFLAVAFTYPKKDVGTEQWQDEHIDDSSPQIEGSNPMASKDP